MTRPNTDFIDTIDIRDERSDAAADARAALISERAAALMAVSDWQMRAAQEIVMVRSQERARYGRKLMAARLIWFAMGSMAVLAGQAIATF